jgi:hypothetical protein
MQIGFFQADLQLHRFIYKLYTQSPQGDWDMQLDYGRQVDMETLYEDYQKEKSPYWRDRIEQTMSSILSEKKASRQLRDELIRVSRVGDKNRMDFLRTELRRLDAETYNNNIQL